MTIFNPRDGVNFFEKGLMKSPHMPLLILVILCAPLIALAAGTNAASSVQTNFIQDAILSGGEVNDVIRLANLCGISNVAEVKTFHYIPSSSRGIKVISSEEASGRTVTFQSLIVLREDWSYKAKPAGSGKLFTVGKFRVEDPSPQVHKLATFSSTNGIIRVALGERISLEEADKMVKAFTTGRIQYQTDSIRRQIQIEPMRGPIIPFDFSKPESVASSDKDAHFVATFAGSLDRFEFILDGDSVTIVSVIHVLV